MKKNRTEEKKKEITEDGRRGLRTGEKESKREGRRRRQKKIKETSKGKAEEKETHVGEV